MSPLKGKCPALLGFIFLLLVSEENDTQNNENVVQAFLERLADYFRAPVYLWPLQKKRAFLILATLARWNPTVGILYQDQLIQMTGLDIGQSTGPNNLRAATIALRRNLDITFVAQGNGVNRRYIFDSQFQRVGVNRFLEDYPWDCIHQLLIDELSSHRRRNY